MDEVANPTTRQPVEKRELWQKYILIFASWGRKEKMKRLQYWS